MMTFFYLLAGALNAGLIYCLSKRQRMWPGAAKHRRIVALSAIAFGILGWAVAALSIGKWTGFFAVLAWLMLVLILLPLIDAWRSKTHVG